jgi:hypothetical protein
MLRNLEQRSGAISKRPASRPSASSAVLTMACERHVRKSVMPSAQWLDGLEPLPLAAGCLSRSCSRTRRLWMCPSSSYQPSMATTCLHSFGSGRPCQSCGQSRPGPSFTLL